MLWTLSLTLAIFWFLGFMGDLGGAFIHLLLLASAAILILQFLMIHRTAA